GLVVSVAGEVVEHHHGGAGAREIMFEREDLPPIAKRALRKQTDFGQAVDDDPGRLDLLDRLEDSLGRLAELEVGRIEEALLLVLVEEAFGRDQLEHRQRVVELPPMRQSADAKLLLGFRQRDVEARLSRRGPREKELRRDRRLAGAGAAFDQIDASALQAARQDIVETGHAGTL